MKKLLEVYLTQHYTDHFIIEVEGKEENEMVEQVRELVQQEMLEAYTKRSRADDGQADVKEISEDAMREIERQFHCERERVSVKEAPLANFDK